MEIFQTASVVRLCSHHDKFLVANDDQETVGQDRDGSSTKARWIVEFPESSSMHIRLKSCHGKYLTASNMPFLIGMKGKRVLQTLPRRLTSSVEWEPVREGVQVRFRTRYGQYLRANGKFPPWRGHITHDVPHLSVTQDWILWTVEILEERQPGASPHLLPPPPVETSSPQHIDSNLDSDSEISLRGPRESTLEADESTEGSGGTFEGRIIKYEVVDENGNVDKTIGERSFTFKGNGVEELKKMLKKEAKVDEEFTICSHNTFNGKLYALRVGLLPNNSAMHVVLVPQSCKGCQFVIIRKSHPTVLHLNQMKHQRQATNEILPTLPQVRLFGWCTTHEALIVGRRLFLVGVAYPHCCLCGSTDESVSHALCDCLKVLFHEAHCLPGWQLLATDEVMQTAYLDANVTASVDRDYTHVVIESNSMHIVQQLEQHHSDRLALRFYLSRARRLFDSHPHICITAFAMCAGKLMPSPIC
ncbi:uncharacterized protein LOC120147488 [Hibiscus syriacus]|uniref:uncharacterized protein LOC120147488 n=1 Tax=Hibiscus syriacus TaxID=106335 RepID=UPI0019205FFF|nr:uncharacterized protein LOC120147488 [Hibiscus syriacus]